MSDNAAREIDRLSGLIGMWRGPGVARFPGLETASYREELRFERIGLEASLERVRL